MSTVIHRDTVSRPGLGKWADRFCRAQGAGLISLVVVFVVSFFLSTASYAAVDVVYEKPEGCKFLERVHAENLSDQQQAIDKLAGKVRRLRGNTLLVLNIIPIEVIKRDTPVRTRYDIEGIALYCKE